jgi:hypothetical protein
LRPQRWCEHYEIEPTGGARKSLRPSQRAHDVIVVIVQQLPFPWLRRSIVAPVEPKAIAAVAPMRAAVAPFIFSSSRIEQYYRTLTESEWCRAMRNADRMVKRLRAEREGAGTVGRRAYAVITW